LRAATALLLFACLGTDLEDLYLEQRESAFELNCSSLRAFLCLELSLDATVYFKSISGILQGDPNYAAF
jgi:hypothetical protein